MNEWRGWLICVDSRRLRGGQPTNKIYAAWIADPEKAVSAVKKFADVTDENVHILVEVSAPLLRGLKAADGKVRSIQSVLKRVRC
jgi:hypothetical protein